MYALHRWSWIRTNSNDVAGHANDAKVPRCALEVLAACEEVDSNGHDIRDRQEDDTRAAECVERGCRTKVDQAEQNFDSCAQQHGVQGHVQLPVDLLPQPRARDGTITGESPDAARGCCRASDTAEDGEDQDRHAEREGTTLVADGRSQDEWQWLSVRIRNDIGDGGHDEHERDQEDETASPVHEESSAHGAGDLNGGVARLLAHAENHARRGGSVCGVQETDAERPAVDPSSGGGEVAEREACGVASVPCDGEGADEDGQDTREGEWNSQGLVKSVRLLNCTCL